MQPIKLISGSSPFCETFLDDVRVPVRNVVGQVNGGWTIAKALLGHERTMIADAFKERDDGATRAASISRAQLPRRRRRRASPTPLLRDRIAQIEMDQACLDLTLRALARQPKAGHAARARDRRSSSSTAPS